MNKQQTIETLQKQLPSFYSLEQVINIINNIEDNSNTLSDDLIQAVIKSTRNALDDDRSELIDVDSAEFNISYDNRLELSCVDIDVDKILEIFEEELDRYVAGPNSDIVELERGE
ncbi:hypothetical protein UFOVP331_133 [uncultured Caudovirales phage]|uniref:Uncharacterized protein n=1 Tax=uncultured Caudovirales phage TaxID=2100421 RepID=A0A6J5LZD0_9CAUD|nr:hypothetical protein UFOVP331_133 [uncultured Caudovirales phage]